MITFQDDRNGWRNRTSKDIYISDMPAELAPVAEFIRKWTQNPAVNPTITVRVESGGNGVILVQCPRNGSKSYNFFKHNDRVIIGQ